jgi:redox-sensitive bicupin YhaK (pirin superfamily)
MTRPRYRDIKAESIPVVKGPGWSMKVICGEYDGVSGPAEDIVIKPWFFDVKVAFDEYRKGTFIKK